MATIALTDSYVRSLKAERGRRLDRSDALCTGLTIRLSASGRKQWLLRYWPADGVQRRHVIGDLNAFSLKAERLEVGRRIVSLSGTTKRTLTRRQGALNDFRLRHPDLHRRHRADGLTRPGFVRRSFGFAEDEPPPRR